MIPIYSFLNKKVVLFGLGKSGLAAAKSLIFGGAKLIVWDDCANAIDNAKKYGLYTKNLKIINWKKIDFLIVSPSIPLKYPKQHWIVNLAYSNNIKIIGDIELFVIERNAFLKRNNINEFNCPFIAITGTNGKSTVTKLIAHLLKESGYNIQIGGNIGTPILSLEYFKKNIFYIIECSSYQIDLSPSINPTIGVLLNIKPDHIDRHGNFYNYFLLKKKIIYKSKFSIICIDDKLCYKIYEFLIKKKHMVLPIATNRVLKNGFFSIDIDFFYSYKKNLYKIGSINKDHYLYSKYYMQNILLSIGCCSFFSLKKNIINYIYNFKRLPHRMEFINKKDHILFINDSKATNAYATAVALQTFNNIYWIAGGIAKYEGINPLKKFFTKIKKVYLIGESAKNFANSIKDSIPIFFAQNLENAVNKAFIDAYSIKNEKAVILLSPASSSFDQFTNYEHRGDDFRIFVKNILISY